MSIIAYTGLPGSGKSYGVVENTIIPALKNGRKVVTNIPLNDEQIGRDFNIDLVKKFETRSVDLSFFDLSQRYAGYVWVIDECQHYFPSGLRQTALKPNVISFFTEHRHFSSDGFATEIILITQDLSQVCNFVRNLVEETYRSKKLTFLGSSKKFVIDVYAGCVTGPKPSIKSKVRQIPGQYKSEIYKYYQSHTKSEGKVTEQKQDDRANLFKSPFFRFVIPFFLVIMVVSFQKISAYFSGHKNDSVSEMTGTKHKLPVDVVSNDYLEFAQKISINLEMLPVSTKYRIVGIINKTYLIQDFNDNFLKVSVSRCVNDPVEAYCVIDNERVSGRSGVVNDRFYSPKSERESNERSEYDLPIPTFGDQKT